MTDYARSPAAAPSLDVAPAGNGWAWVLASGILSLLLGVLAFLWPFAATFAATLVIGAFFVAAGLVSIGAGIFGKGHGARGYAIGFGLASLIIGGLLVLEPLTGALSLTLMVAVWLAVRGALEIGFGFRLRHGKALMLALGIVNILLAIFVLATLPMSALTLPGFILALSFVMSGVTSILSALHHRRGASAFAIR